MNDLAPFAVTQTPNPAGAGMPCNTALVNQWTLLPAGGAGSALTIFSLRSGIGIPLCVVSVMAFCVSTMSVPRVISEGKAKL
jgi:hypothetical protein